MDLKTILTVEFELLWHLKLQPSDDKSWAEVMWMFEKMNDRLREERESIENGDRTSLGGLLSGR